MGYPKRKKAVMLLDIKELGDRKPSEVMDKMLALLGDHRPCFLFRHIFLRLLPEAIRAPLANSSNISDYRALAKEADNLKHTLFQIINILLMDYLKTVIEISKHNINTHTQTHK